jgi:hypothetical protein
VSLSASKVSPKKDEMSTERRREYQRLYHQEYRRKQKSLRNEVTEEESLPTSDAVAVPELQPVVNAEMTQVDTTRAYSQPEPPPVNTAKTGEVACDLVAMIEALNR